MDGVSNVASERRKKESFKALKSFELLLKWQLYLYQFLIVTIAIINDYVTIDHAL